MLFKEKLYLANCDSVRRLSSEEIHKRFMVSVVFADGVVFSPNVLIDNPGVLDMLSRRNVATWFQEEGRGRVEVRGVGLNPSTSLVEYFDNLPDSYLVSRFRQRPKGELNDAEKDLLRRELEHTQRQLVRFDARWEPLTLQPDTLTQQVLSRYEPLWESEYFSHDAQSLGAVRSGEVTLISRSDWYRYLASLPCMSVEQRNRFTLEVVDAAYNSLFIRPGEAFAMDRIACLTQLPNAMLDGGMQVRLMRRQREWLGHAYRLFNLVTSLGSEGLARVLMDEALGYAEDKLVEQGMDWMTRRNWYGLYPRMTRWIGVELKT